MSYQFFTIDDVQFIIIFILRDTEIGIGAASTALFELYVQFRYPSYCFGVDACKKLFLKQIKSRIEEPIIRNITVPLTDGQILYFLGILHDLNDNYQGGEYELDVNFFRKN